MTKANSYIVRVGDGYVTFNPWLLKYQDSLPHWGPKDKAHHFITSVCALQAKHHLMDAGVGESIIEVEPSNYIID